MKKITTSTAAVCTLVLGLPSFAAGPRNDTNNAARSMSDSVQQTPNTGGVAPEDSGAAQKQSPQEAALAEMRASGEAAKRVQSMSKVAFVKIVDLGAGGEAIDKAMTENRTGIEALRNAIRANTSLDSKLKEKSVKPEQVVAVKLNDDGSLTIYVNKSA